MKFKKAKRILLSISAAAAFAFTPTSEAHAALPYLVPIFSANGHYVIGYTLSATGYATEVLTFLEGTQLLLGGASVELAAGAGAVEAGTTGATGVAAGGGAASTVAGAVLPAVPPAVAVYYAYQLDQAQGALEGALNQGEILDQRRTGSKEKAAQIKCSTMEELYRDCRNDSVVGGWFWCAGLPRC